MKEIHTGITGRAEWQVTAEMTAAQVGSGLVAVFSTPMMVALMEAAAVNSLQGYLEDGRTSVGTHIEVGHLAATPVGFTVHATAVLTAIEDRRLTFTIEAWDEQEKIGEAVHQRVIVDTLRFQTRADHKRANHNP